MDFTVIETNRLLLKGLSPEDMRAIFNDLPKSEIKETLGHRSEEDYQKEEYKHLNGYSSYNRSFKLFLLVDKESGLIIGRCGLHNWNEDNKRAEIGYVMHNDDFKQKGLMSEAVKAILDYGFKELNLNRIEALVGVSNIPSIKILEKYNFQQEGILRQHVCIAGNFEDSILFSKLHDEHQS
jgi:ribosomal-protein-alanine N-acetyltransferase